MTTLLSSSLEKEEAANIERRREEFSPRREKGKSDGHRRAATGADETLVAALCERRGRWTRAQHFIPTSPARGKWDADFPLVLPFGRIMLPL